MNVDGLARIVGIGHCHHFALLPSCNCDHSHWSGRQERMLWWSRTWWRTDAALLLRVQVLLAHLLEVVLITLPTQLEPRVLLADKPRALQDAVLLLIIVLPMA